MTGSASAGTTCSTSFAERMHDAFAAGRPNDVMYFVGRPGEDGFADRFLETWGCDGHNSHTNVCSSGGRAGYGLWMGTDRPSPDYANAKFTLLISSHLEAGHYFNPHAQRIIEGKQPRRARSRCIDPGCRTPRRCRTTGCPPGRGPRPRCCWRWRRCCSTRTSSTASSSAAGSTGARTWPTGRPAPSRRFERFLARAARRVRAATRPSSPRPRAACRRRRSCRSRARSPPPRRRSPRTSGARRRPGNLHGWQITRALWLLNVLTGSVGHRGRRVAERVEQVHPGPVAQAVAEHGCGTSSTGRASSRSRTTR